MSKHPAALLRSPLVPRGDAHFGGPLMIGARPVPPDLGRGTGLALTSVASVQFGAALAAKLFALVGPLGTVTLRLVGASIVLVAVARPWRRSWTGVEIGASLLFGAVFTAMNTALYLAIDRLPLATVITVEFLGPLTVAVVTATSWRTRIWAVPAAAGVALLGGTLSSGDTAGVAYALAAALCWAAYILLSGRLGRSGSGLAGLSAASVFGAVLILPFGVLTAGPALIHPVPLAVGLAVGVLSSAIPYSLDLLALRRLPTAVFGVLTSLNPAVAALAGLVVLGEHVPGRQAVGIALVMVAGAGVTLGSAGRGHTRGRGPLARRSHALPATRATLGRYAAGCADRTRSPIDGNGKTAGAGFGRANR